MSAKEACLSFCEIQHWIRLTYYREALISNELLAICVGDAFEPNGSKENNLTLQYVVLLLDRILKLGKYGFGYRWALSGPFSETLADEKQMVRWWLYDNEPAVYEKSGLAAVKIAVDCVAVLLESKPDGIETMPWLRLLASLAFAADPDKRSNWGPQQEVIKRKILLSDRRDVVQQAWTLLVEVGVVEDDQTAET